jgi:hypothetical protein
MQNPAFCACRILPSVLDHPLWKQLVWNLASDVSSPSGSKVKDTFIPQEASAAKSRKIEQLKTQCNLTISFDGGTMQSSQSSVTCHITQEDGKVIFF